MPHLKQLLLCSVLLFMLATAAAFAKEAKNALLIANGEYGRNMGALSQPVPEARELKSALESIGFKVTLVQNADLDGMCFTLKSIASVQGAVLGDNSLKDIRSPSLPTLVKKIFYCRLRRNESTAIHDGVKIAKIRIGHGCSRSIIFRYFFNRL